MYLRNAIGAVEGLVTCFIVEDQSSVCGLVHVKSRVHTAEDREFEAFSGQFLKLIFPLELLELALFCVENNIDLLEMQAIDHDVARLPLGFLDEVVNRLVHFLHRRAFIERIGVVWNAGCPNHHCRCLSQPFVARLLL